MAIDSSTKVLAIIGDPIEHSLTPRIQNAAWRNLNAPQQTYNVLNVAFRVQQKDLELAVRGAQKMGLLGLMVTIPHKEKVLSLCDELDISAQDVGASNLLHFRSDGAIVGYSSDGWAAIKSLEEEGVQLENSRVAIMGGGGGARSLALCLARAGISHLRLLNRTVERAEKIVQEVKALNPLLDVLALPSQKSTFEAVLPECDILVNATSMGMSPHVDGIPLNSNLLKSLPGHAAVYDIVYNPLETRLLKAARGKRLRVIDGLGMLIYTNVRAAQICAQAELSAAVMRREALAALKD
ncbi:MAG: shikimate dehydrogenase [Abditibacteriaceae bacterium]